MSTFTIFLILIIFVAFLLVIVVMVQNPKGGGLASSFGGGGTQQLGGVKKTTDFLDKSTWTLATLLLALILLSNISIMGNVNTTEDIFDEGAIETQLPGGRGATLAVALVLAQRLRHLLGVCGDGCLVQLVIRLAVEAGRRDGLLDLAVDLANHVDAVAILAPHRALQFVCQLRLDAHRFIPRYVCQPTFSLLAG